MLLILVRRWSGEIVDLDGSPLVVLPVTFMVGAILHIVAIHLRVLCCRRAALACTRGRLRKVTRLRRRGFKVNILIFGTSHFAFERHGGRKQGESPAGLFILP